MKFFHKKLICFILTLSLLGSIPFFASASQRTVYDKAKDITDYHDSLISDSGEQNSICLLTEGQYVTTQPIQLVDTNNKADVNYNVLSGFGSILYQKSIVIDGVENPLLCTFEDPEDSLQLTKTKCSSILNILSNKYSLDELDESNWKDYQKAIDNYSSDPDANEMYKKQGNLLKQFQSLEAVLYIYEDTFLDNAVLDFVSLANTKLSDHTISKIVLDNLLGYLPYTDPLVKKNQKSLVSARTRKISPNQISGLTNITAANNYALTYAESPNIKYGFYENGDCTNFVSQICKEGGVLENDRWHSTYYPIVAVPTNTWTVAHEFANYWKPRWYTGLTTGHYLDFSAQLYTKGGSVIGMDTAGNKVYHHLAYVTQRANNKKTKFGRTFYDFYICQHSSNYKSWASDNKGTANGWVNAPDGTIFAIFS